ncbi:MAG: SUMF1/EgtB/PvdO family nonheme iron enzyme [Myxococcales bacterium]|nr:formylglycine-generating enzyme family protein [Polyangiaceae bacterium]MDW8249224.1 SUMF1/EgtB/PvdO family nonheme iron enzyme [Myxococcales bacterium]
MILRVLPWSLAVAAAALLLATTPTTGARPRRPHPRPTLLPSAPTASGLPGGFLVLKAPPPSEIRIGAGTFIMGSTMHDLLRAKELCKLEAKAGACELPLLREMQLHGTLEGVRPEDLLGNEMEPHPVTLSPFWIDQREITVEEYLRCTEVGPCRKPPYEAGARRFANPGFPVSYVSWEDARVYCAWRGKRLPTEAEWERAARGLAGRTFPWGHAYNRRASNHGRLGTTFRVFHNPLRGQLRERMSTLDHDEQDGYLELAPVGSFPDGRTPDGIDDLAGNVAEWVADLYEPRYSEAAVTNPKGPASSQSPFRVIRGGSYLHGVPWLRGASRLMALPEERMSWIGFRCARSDDPVSPL